MGYGWLSFATAKTQLAQRLADPGKVFWTDAELACYLSESLRTWNALTATWKTSFACTIAAASKPTWYSLGAMAESPRQRTLTDVALYTAMQYHLLEPATGGVWGGSSQFSIADFQLALQRCRDEAIQVANSNQQLITVKTTPGDRVVQLPDSVLDIARVRWMPVEGAPVTLMRNDDVGLGYYQQDWLQSATGIPTQYILSTSAPLTLQVDSPPSLPGVYECIALVAPDAFTPPAPSPLAVPDDFASVLKWGALADLLSRESEATDLPRAAFCRKRYTDGLKLLAATPWIIQTDITGISSALTDFTQMDEYRPEWDSQYPEGGTIILGGIDFFTVVPDEDDDIGVNLRLLGNAPVPVKDDDLVQVSRDAWDPMLDYAQFLAAFKQGGAEFESATQLEESFIQAAAATTDRLSKLGLYSDVIQQQGTKELRSQERYTSRKR